MPEFDNIAYANDYNRTHYDRVNLMFPKGFRGEVKDYARERGETLNSYVLRLIREDMERTQTKKGGE